MILNEHYLYILDFPGLTNASRALSITTPRDVAIADMFYKVLCLLVIVWEIQPAAPYKLFPGPSVLLGGSGSQT